MHYTGKFQSSSHLSFFSIASVAGLIRAHMSPDPTSDDILNGDMQLQYTGLYKFSQSVAFQIPSANLSKYPLPICSVTLHSLPMQLKVHKAFYSQS